MKDGNPIDGLPFYPYFVIHDLVPIVVFLFVFCAVLFFMPEMGGFFLEYANFEIANSLKTPEHIAPVWYFTPYYSMLRAVPDKLGGFIIMGAAIAILFVLPWLDRSPVRSMRYKGNISRAALLMFAAVFIILGYLGVKAPTAGRTHFGADLYRAVLLVLYWYLLLDQVRDHQARACAHYYGRRHWYFKTLGAIGIVALLVVIPIKAVGAESGHACGTIDCEPLKLS